MSGHRTPSRWRATTARRRLAIGAVAAVAGLGLVATVVAQPAVGAGSTSAGSDRASSAAASTKKLSLRVDTPYGDVQGRRLGGAQAFLGLPFAKAPVYDRMFTAPVDAARWRGVRDATQHAPACLQFEPTGVKNDQATSLDCLYLDVYRPARMTKGEKLPVMLWYHGGGSTQGAGLLYGGQTMADREHVIVVSTNYRLGASGGLALPALDAEQPTTGSGNYAILDQLQALKWVQKSIRSFGGDRDNVTIFGQSAGGRGVCNMLALRAAAGLFDRAIIQSSTCATTGTSVAAAQKTSQAYAEAAGCPDGDDQLACLRKAWPADLVTAQKGHPVVSSVVGTPVLPQAPGAAIAAGRWNKVPVLTGNTRWEQRLQNQQYSGITEAEYTAMVMQTYGATNGPRVLAQYPAADYDLPFYALASLKTDAGAGCGLGTSTASFRSQGVPVYRYEFDDPTSPTLFGFQPAGIDMSSAHSGELAYLFDFTLGDRPLTARQKQLGRTMQTYWASFARSADPNTRGEVTWPRYTVQADRALKLGPTVKVVTGLGQEHNCAFWASLQV